MNEENYVSEFREKFATIEDALKYIADSQAESERFRKQDQIEGRKRMVEVEKKIDQDRIESRTRMAGIEKNLEILTQDRSKSRKRMAEVEKITAQDKIESQKRMAEVERHLAHITKVLRFNIETYEFQEDKLEKAGEILQRKKL